MKRTKAIISILLAAVMALAMLCACANETANSPEPEGSPMQGSAQSPDTAVTPWEEHTEVPMLEMPEEAVLTEVLRCGIGDGDDQFGIDMSAEGNVPEAFSIFDDSIAILDSVKRRVCVYEGGALARTIDLTQAHPLIYGYSMARLGDSLFVL